MIFIHLGMRMSRQPVQQQTIIPECAHHTATTEQLPNAGLMPVHRQQGLTTLNEPKSKWGGY